MSERAIISTESEPKVRHTINVAVYWPPDGYGVPKRCRTMEAARDEVQKLLRLGYGRAGKNPIHIISTTSSTIEVVRVATTPPAEAEGE